MILLIYPPGWISLYPAQPLGIATLASILDREHIPYRQLDLEIMIHEHNRLHPQSRIPMEQMPDWEHFSALLEKPFRLHESCEPLLESMLPLLTEKATGVAFSIIGERQFIASSILASYFRSKGIPVAAGGLYVARNADWIAQTGLFNALFTAFDPTEFASLCRNILRPDAASGFDAAPRVFDGVCDLDLLPKLRFSTSMAPLYRRALKEIYKTESEHSLLQYVLDTGCTQRCSFCTRFHGKYDRKSTAKIADEIAELAAAHGTPLFSMTTNAINFDPRWTLRLCSEIAARSTQLEWDAYAIPDLNDPELIRGLARAGCKVLRFGLESASEKILAMLNKQFSPRQAARCFELVHNAGIWVQVSFMTGCPNETQEDVGENCRFIERCHASIDSIRINPFFLQRGSDMERRPENYGIRPHSRNGLNRGFDEAGGLDWAAKVKATLKGINEMYAAMRSKDIGFYGISPHMLLSAIHENGSKERTRRWFDRVHPFMNDNLPPEWIQWRIYHAHEPELCPYGNTWESNYGLVYEKGAAPAQV